MADMIERVARVIEAALERHGVTDYEGTTDDARAALEAMRKPTPKMLRAAAAAMSPGKRPTLERVSERAKHGIRYRAMIDAALPTPPVQS